MNDEHSVFLHVDVLVLAAISVCVAWKEQCDFISYHVKLNSVFMIKDRPLLTWCFCLHHVGLLRLEIKSAHCATHERNKTFSRFNLAQMQQTRVTVITTFAVAFHHFHHVQRLRDLFQILNGWNCMWKHSATCFQLWISFVFLSNVFGLTMCQGCKI